MKRIVISVIMMVTAGSVYAADFDQLAINAKDIKVLSAVNKDIATPSRGTSNQDNGPAFQCSGSGAYWGFDMKPGFSSEYVPQGYWAFSWPGPQAVKPVKPIISRDTYLYKTGDGGTTSYTIVIAKCPAPGCRNIYQSAPQPYQIIVISEMPQFPSQVLMGTCVAK